MKDFLFTREAVPDGGGDGGAGEPEVAAEPEAPEGPWAPSQEEWGQVTGFIGQAAPILEQLLMQQQQYGLPDQQFQQQQQQPEEEFDPFDPESVQRYIHGQIQNGVNGGLQEALGPYQGLLGIMASQHGEQLARTELEQIKGQLGDFNEDAAFLVASGLIEQGGDPSAALRQAAQYSQEWEKNIRADEREKYKAELQVRQGAPGETPVGSASAAQEEGVPTGVGRYEEAVRRALANRQPTFPVG